MFLAYQGSALSISWQEKAAMLCSLRDMCDSVPHLTSSPQAACQALYPAKEGRHRKELYAGSRTTQRLMAHG